MNRSQSRLFIIGAGGFVGGWLAARAGAQFHVIRSARRLLDPLMGGSYADDAPAGEQIAFDITDADAVATAFALARPDVVVLTAALADIDRCQSEQALAEQVNYLGPLHVARACAGCGARLVFTSTDAVFDGNMGFYRETDPPTPPNYYGETKVRAEAAVLDALPGAAVARLSLVLGRGLTPGTNSYVDRFAARLARGETIDVPTYEVRNPIDIGTLAKLLLELAAAREASGIFHIGSTDKMSRYELSRRLAEAMGYNPDQVTPRDEPIAGQVARGTDTYLSTERLRAHRRTPLPTCAEVIERSVAIVV